jgi:1-pyrroline-5-carboxylate dehydrogenase
MIRIPAPAGRSFRYAASFTRRWLSSRAPWATNRIAELKDFATIDADRWDAANPHTVMNLLAGSWTTTKDTEEVLDPLNGDAIMRVPLTSVGELPAFVNSMRTCSKSGLHNPLKNVDRYVKLGEVSDRIANAMKQPAIADFFAKLTMRVSPKSYAQALNEVKIVWQFLDNFSGDNVRYLARGFNV